MDKIHIPLLMESIATRQTFCRMFESHDSRYEYELTM